MKLKAVPYFLVAVIVFSSWFAFFRLTPNTPGIDAAPAPTSTPAPMVTPTPGTTNQASIFWGDTLHLLCYEDAQAKEQHEPSGILNFDVTDSGVVAINCREPGTVRGE